MGLSEYTKRLTELLDEAACADPEHMNCKTGRFKGGKGERFDNCVASMRTRGDVRDPEALCAAIARKKGLAPGGEAVEPVGAPLGEGTDAFATLAKQFQDTVVRLLHLRATWPTTGQAAQKKAQDQDEELVMALDEIVAKLPKAWDAWKGSM